MPTASPSLIVAFFFVLSFIMTTSFAETINIRADIWAPFNSAPNDQQYPGYFIEVIKAIFEKEGISINYANMPWNRCVAETRNGLHDAVIGASILDAAGFIFPKEPLYITNNIFFIKSNTKWKYNGISSLKGKVLGAIYDYDYSHKEFKEYLNKFQNDKKIVDLTRGDNPVESNIKKLILGRIDILIESREVLRWTMKQMNIPQDSIIEAGDLGIKQEVYMAFSPSPSKLHTKRYIQIFDQGMKKLRDTGELKKYLDKYLLNDFK